MSRLYHYHGTRSTAGVLGRFSDMTPAQFIERAFDLNEFRRLRVTDSDGDLVGEITVVDGQRTWWAIEDPEQP